MSKELIRLVGCTMAFDDEIVLNDINLYINDKEFLTLLGPSAAAAKPPRFGSSADFSSPQTATCFSTA
jgi:ABC-type Mn2+/Zn2+ transport system ATPase subunit